MVLRKATSRDASSIAAISIEVWVGTYLKNGGSAFFADYALAEFTVEKTKKLIDDPGQLIVVSEKGRRHRWLHKGFDKQSCAGKRMF